MILGVLPEGGGSIANLARSGQAGRFVQGYLARYAAAFERVYYFSYLHENPPVPDNVQVVPNPGHHRWLYALRMPSLHQALFRGCDVLRVMQAYGALPAQLARARWGTPYITTYGYNYFANARAEGRTLRPYLFWLRAAWGARSASRVIVTTPRMAAYVGRFVPPERLLLIPNGVDVARFCPPAAPPPADPARILYVGRLSPEKNLALLLEALARLPRQAARLVMVGDGELRPALQARAGRDGLPVDFLGVVPHEQLPALYGQASLFVLPSQREGHPKALLEAMSCARPCLGTDVPGIRELVRHGETGWLVAPEAGTLAGAMQRLLGDAPLAAQLGEAARREVQAHYSLEVLLEREIAALKEAGRQHARERQP